MTQWKSLKELVEYGDYYAVNEEGQVKNVTTGKILKGCKDGHGYHKVQLYKDKKFKNHKIHRLVAIAFIPNPYNKPMVNHLDGNQLNNAAYNLEWSTNQENLKHAFDNGIAVAKIGSEVNGARLTEDEVITIKQELMKGTSQKELAYRFGVSESTIQNIQYGNVWTHVEVEGFTPFKSEVNSKPNLTKEQVIKIRELYAKGEYKQKDLSEMFNTTVRSISRIITRKVYKHI